MLDLILLILLLAGFLIGLKRGFILQSIHLAGFIAAFIVASIYCTSLAEKLTLWIPYPSTSTYPAADMILGSSGMEQAFYRAIAFAVIFFFVKIVLQMIGAMLDFVAHLPVIKSVNVWAGGLLGFAEVYLIAFILLYIAALMPLEAVQGPLQDSLLAEGIVKHTPIFSAQIKELWIQYVAA
ncbi:CvpA family protein [Mesobacillus zeae]|uniref:CvpA family protein n=1 Tax=Mesobacillus zeae TaxID=1917180 RepID=A0A398B613_9BACI|nr:CvpA family protein [Mesobacillus zeae]RID83196.1 CvpA family protein [Mesobacillus zeae]